MSLICIVFRTRQQGDGSCDVIQIITTGVWYRTRGTMPYFSVPWRWSLQSFCRANTRLCGLWWLVRHRLLLCTSELIHAVLKHTTNRGAVIPCRWGHSMCGLPMEHRPTRQWHSHLAGHRACRLVSVHLPAAHACGLCCAH